MKYLIMGLMLSLMIIGSTQAQDGSCGLESRLNAGDVGRVLPGDANNVREAANRSAAQTGRLAGGFYFRVLDGVACSGGFTWREIEYGGFSLARGWTVEATGSEYYLEASPYSGTPITSIQYGTSFVIPEENSSLEAIFDFYPPDIYSDGSLTFPAYVNIIFIDREREMSSMTLNIYSSDAYDRNPDDFEGMFEGAFGFTVKGLNRLLDGEVALSDYDVVSNHQPDLSPGAAEGMLAYLDEMNFANGAGLRFITYYAQDFEYARWDTVPLKYRFNGLSDDRRYLVVADAVLEAPSFPVPNEEGCDLCPINTAYNEAFFNAIPADEWTPNLDHLDQLIMSLVTADIFALDDEFEED